jgi:hypothetical protein
MNERVFFVWVPEGEYRIMVWNEKNSFVGKRKLEGRWEQTELKYLKRGDFFKSFENDGKPVVFEELSVFIAKSDPYKKDEIWSIDI